MRKLLRWIVLWAIGGADLVHVRSLALMAGDALVIVKPWWMGDREAHRLGDDLAAALHIKNMFILPDGATLAALHAAPSRLVDTTGVPGKFGPAEAEAREGR